MTQFAAFAILTALSVGIILAISPLLV